MTLLRGSAALCGAALLLATLGGCLAPPRVPLPADPPTVRLAVPYLPQSDYQCGPAAVAMVMAALDRPVPPEVLSPQIYSPALRGSLQPALVAAGRRHGLLAWELDDFGDILAEVAAGRPVIILQNRGLSWRPLWHYAVVVGYDAAQRQVLLTSGTERERAVALRTVLATWERGGRWGLLLLPPGALPQRAGADRLLTALAGLERVAPDTALTGYAAATQRWPDAPLLAVGYGNLLRSAGRVQEAEAAYRAALRVDAVHVPALNNLADLLLLQGRLAEARSAAAAAAAVASPFRDSAAATLREIDERLAAEQPP